MLDLSPTKLLIIFVVAVVLLGPKRLPHVARQLGAGWRRIREFTRHLDQEVRQSLPDLPPNQEIVRLARSPVALLNQLADLSPRPEAAADDTGAAPAGPSVPGDTSPPTPARNGAAAAVHGAPPGTATAADEPVWDPASGALAADDPSLN